MENDIPSKWKLKASSSSYTADFKPDFARREKERQSIKKIQ
jgi:hypothetical protein